ncbi:MAG TPA: DUF3596 domain-containing protein [Syntrophobacteraceae bacterium]|nr:DUF3596 domain-containing protein [Syntrophobacteraceae bacterium]
MANARASQGNVVAFPGPRKRREKKRKSGLNHNKEGSVRNVNGRVYVDFIYLDERVRESSGLDWNEKNAKTVREQLDKIIAAISSGTFRFAEVFPESKNRDLFSEKEKEKYGAKPPTPDEVLFGEYANKWLSLLEGSGRVSGRTLREYKSYLNHYLIPFFGEMTFAELNAHSFEKFILWARQRELKKISVCNKSINKYFVPMKMICKQAAIEYKWSTGFEPFFGHERLPEDDVSEKIVPFTIEEQAKLRQELPDHWKPYFDFAFRTGLRPGEQIAIKPEDIDWPRGLLHIRRSITLDEDGKRTEGTTKNKYSRRTIKLTPAMLEALSAQKAVHDQFGCEYFFCSREGRPIHLSNVRRRVWIPALKRAGLAIREMKQTRHTFATVALSCGENPLWIAKTMGHRNSEMIIKVYSRYVENIRGTEDGSIMDRIYQVNKGKEE